MSETQYQQKPIPIFIYNLDLAQILEICRVSGYGNNFERWTDSKLEEKNLSSSTIREIQYYKTKKIDDSMLKVINRVFGRNFSNKEEWQRILEGARELYEYRVDLGHKFKTSNITLPECLLRGPRSLFNPDGTWLYGLANYDGRSFDVGGDMIFGYFIIDNMELKAARNYLYRHNKEGPSQRNLEPHAIWHAQELAVGPDNLYIRYVSDRTYSEETGKQVIAGFMSGKLSHLPPLFGGARIKGDFHDLNSDRYDCRGEFYAERVSSDFDIRTYGHTHCAIIYEHMESFQR